MAISVAGGVRPGKVIEIEHRLYKQLIVGKQKSDSMFDELDAELEDDANKLAIEREAVLERLAKQIEAKQVFERVSEQLIKTVSNAVNHRLASADAVIKSAGVNESQLLMLELLQGSNIDINRLRPLIANESWLVRDLLNIVNSTSFRHRRPKGSDVKLTDLKLVLNFIGIENIKLLIPHFCLRNWLPSGHANLLWTTRKLWRYSMVSAIAAQALGKLHEKDSIFVYICTLLSQLGPSVVLKNSTLLFEETWGLWLGEANNSRDKELYDAVLVTEFPSQKVYELVIEHGDRLNWQLLQQLNFSDSPMTSVMAELDNNLSYKDLSENASIVARANCYAKVVLLEEMKLINPQEKRIMFDYYELSEQELIRLKGQNYRKLNII
ncbi:histidine kinase [Shewanella hanedai]|uniref:HDOD domain-containing protein n=1 Tax=Shewanella hanedai TaxID=25 RepID=A0A553JTJ3_SHEHA|nr:HDOD domain-containing protein [Shewanella hanedai]TRY15776.1 HDOD domain-containing protein [Shewanella hanedai]GGI70678.1 histidine kinase [Shewanella hanedai]